MNICLCHIWLTRTLFRFGAFSDEGFSEAPLRNLIPPRGVCAWNYVHALVFCAKQSPQASLTSTTRLSTCSGIHSMHTPLRPQPRTAPYVSGRQCTGGLSEGPGAAVFPDSLCAASTAVQHRNGLRAIPSYMQLIRVQQIGMSYGEQSFSHLPAFFYISKRSLSNHSFETLLTLERSRLHFHCSPSITALRVHIKCIMCHVDPVQPVMEPITREFATFSLSRRECAAVGTWLTARCALPP